MQDVKLHHCKHSIVSAGLWQRSKPPAASLLVNVRLLDDSRCLHRCLFCAIVTIVGRTIGWRLTAAVAATLQTTGETPVR